MPKPRGRTDVPGVYHAQKNLSLEVDPWSESDQQEVLETIENWANYCDIELLAYAITPWHFEVLGRVGPETKGRSDSELLARFRNIHPDASWREVEALLRNHGPTTEKGADVRKKLQPYGISQWMSGVAQSVTLSVNQARGQRGSIWAKRYDCYRVEDSPEYLLCATARIACVANWEAESFEVSQKEALKWPSSFGAALNGDPTYRRYIRAATGCSQWPRAVEMIVKCMGEQNPSTRVSRIYGNVEKLPSDAVPADRIRCSGNLKERERWRSKRLKELAALVKQGVDINLLQRTVGKGPENWLCRQRAHYLAGRLSEEVEAALLKLGYDFGPRPPRGRRSTKPLFIKGERANQNARWNAKYERLQAFNELHGHCRVTKYDGDHSLYIWVMAQRTFRRIDKLPADRVERLDALNFVWEPRG